MTFPEFLKLASAMRQAQKEHDRTRSDSALETSKAAERKLDQAIMEITSNNEQGRMW